MRHLLRKHCDWCPAHCRGPVLKRGLSQAAAVTQANAPWNGPKPTPAADMLRSETLRAPSRASLGGIVEMRPLLLDARAWLFWPAFYARIPPTCARAILECICDGSGH